MIIEKKEKQLPVKTLARIMSNQDWCQLRVWLEYRYYDNTMTRKTRMSAAPSEAMQMLTPSWMSANIELKERQRITNQIINSLAAYDYKLDDPAEIGVNGVLSGVRVVGRIDVLLVPKQPALKYKIIEVKTNQNKAAVEQVAIYLMLARSGLFERDDIKAEVRERAGTAWVYSDEAAPFEVVVDHQLIQSATLALGKAAQVINRPRNEQEARIFGSTCEYCVATTALCRLQKYE